MKLLVIGLICIQILCIILGTTQLYDGRAIGYFNVLFNIPFLVMNILTLRRLSN
jgi:hypothetical protein